MSLTIGKKLSLSTILFSLAAIIPFAVLAVMAVSTARDSFINDKFDQLVSIREVKKAQVKDFFQEKQSDMGVLLRTVEALKNAAVGKLEAVQEIKKAQVEKYFRKIFSAAEVVANNPNVALGLNRMTTAMKSDGFEREHHHVEIHRG